MERKNWGKRKYVWCCTQQHCVQKLPFFFLFIFSAWLLLNVDGACSLFLIVQKAHNLCFLAAINVCISWMASSYIIFFSLHPFYNYCLAFDLKTDALGNKLRCLKVRCKNIAPSFTPHHSFFFFHSFFCSQVSYRCEMILVFSGPRHEKTFYMKFTFEAIT